LGLLADSGRGHLTAPANTDGLRQISKGRAEARKLNELPRPSKRMDKVHGFRHDRMN
jgi:hypothetical protein